MHDGCIPAGLWVLAAVRRAVWERRADATAPRFRGRRATREVLGSSRKPNFTVGDFHGPP